MILIVFDKLVNVSPDAKVVVFIFPVFNNFDNVVTFKLSGEVAGEQEIL